VAWARQGDDLYLASGSGDGTVRVWQAPPTFGGGQLAGGGETATPAPTPIPTPQVLCTARVNVNSNLREGPGEGYTRVGRAPEGSRVLVVGQNPSGDWLQLELEAGDRVWIAAILLDDLGCPEGVTLPIVP
jgi:N-acetylmuramoyl-L-alanine amidase